MPYQIAGKPSRFSNRSIQDANHNTTNFSYDAFGRVTQTNFPSGYIETYGYDNVGNLTSKTDRKNQQITYTYDQLNRLTLKTYPDTASVNYTYDNDSRLTQVPGWPKLLCVYTESTDKLRGSTGIRHCRSRGWAN